MAAGGSVGAGATVSTGSSGTVPVVADSVVAVVAGAVSAGAVSATVGALPSDPVELESLPQAARLTTVMMTGTVRDRIGRTVLSPVSCMRRNGRPIGRIDPGLEE